MSSWRQSMAWIVVGVLTANGAWLSEGSADEMPRKLAFLTGVSKYLKDGLADLAYAEEDVHDLAEEFRRHGFETTEVVGQQATLESLRAELSEYFAELAKLNKDDVAVLAFSGHGLQLQVSRDGKLVEEPFFCPVDAQRNNPDSLISLNWVIEQVAQQSGSSQNLLIIDACRNNPAKGAKGVDGSSADRLPNKISVLFSSSAGGRSYESELVRHGVFTHFLLEGIQGGAADRRGRITWLNLASYVMEVVPAKTPELMGNEDIVQRPNLLGNLSSQPVLAVMSVREANRPPFPAPDGRPRISDELLKRMEEAKAKGKSFKGPPSRPERAAPPGATKTVNSVNPRVDVKSITASPGIVMVKLPAGEFLMGSPESDVGRGSGEELPHLVKIARPFLMGAYEVTQEEFDHVLTGNTENTSRFPATYLSWYDAVDFCNRLSEIEGLPPYYRLNNMQEDGDTVRSADAVTVLGGNGYRLPTEAEWEYACRAGTTTAYYFGDKLDRQQVNVGRDREDHVPGAPPNRGRALEVGSFPPNPWGLYDMHGNVSEWCHESPRVGSLRSQRAVNRGGSWFYMADLARSAASTRVLSSGGTSWGGFRIARDVE